MIDKDKADELFEIARYMIVLYDRIEKLIKQGKLARAKTIIKMARVLQARAAELREDG